mmetsp:Transcript_83916/g.250388  ORF Transcript_83916/g.250388 Transcript_83916/m.250388 type:complete len:400 (+) Transcript_83916:162-1361(+)
MVVSPEKIAGEWLINASIMQCQDAIFGRVHFTEHGDMVYLAGGGDLIGRGVGRWVAEGPVFGFQVDIYQYTLTSAKHTHLEPHRFRGVAKLPQEKDHWAGEWHFCAFQQPPRVVGSFHAHRRASGPPLSQRPPDDCPTEAKKAVIAKLDKMSELPPMAEPRWIPHHLTGKIKDVHYVRSFLEPRQVEEFERIIDKTCEFEHMNTRDTQEFGASNRCPCGRSLLRVALPQWQNNMITALHNLGVFHPVLYPANSIRINAYRPGQGIHPHLDGPVYYPRAAIVSLGSQCIFDFYPRLDLDEDQRGFSWDRDREVPAAPELPPGTKPALSILLEPGSLLVFSGDAFIHHRHGIAACEEDEIGPHIRNARDIGLSVGDSLRRARRVSLTVRHLLPRCMCSSLV